MAEEFINCYNNFRKQGRIALLFLLYLSQGLPFGYQATALPVYLREKGISLEIIGFSTILASPWLLKVFWAPLVDRFWNGKIGRRKSWIIPLQVLLFTSIVTASYTSQHGLYPLMINILIMNFIAATQDIAVDGLAVDILGKDELGYGNAAQVIGYKSGMIFSGGVLVWLTGFLPWSVLFKVMAIVAIIPLIAVIPFREQYSCYESRIKLNIRDIINALSQSLKRKSFQWMVIFVASYKFGEIMIDVMYKPFLLDSGISGSQVGLWVGTYGMFASIAGSAAGGLISSKLTIYRALLLSSILRLFPLVYVTMLTFIRPDPGHVIMATILEHFFGGMLTTALFAFMMLNVNRTISATHYTLLAAIEVLGKTPGGIISGIFTGIAGYSACFITGTLISFAVIFILPLYRKSSERDDYEIQTMY